MSNVAPLIKASQTSTLVEMPNDELPQIMGKSTIIIYYNLLIFHKKTREKKFTGKKIG